MITRVQRLSVPVSDLDRAKCFYVDTLGLELVNDVPLPGDGARWVEVAPPKGGTTILLVRTAAVTKSACAHGLMLETSELDAECRRLRRAGVAVDAPQETPWGRQVIVRDPDGNGIALLEAQPAAPYHVSWLAWRYATPLGDEEP
jgi:catechol 2,3-dioxygenase-like lactoylglutathione lyase family enzyme